MSQCPPSPTCIAGQTLSCAFQVTAISNSIGVCKVSDRLPVAKRFTGPGFLMALRVGSALLKQCQTARHRLVNPQKQSRASQTELQAAPAPTCCGAPAERWWLNGSTAHAAATPTIASTASSDGRLSPAYVPLCFRTGGRLARGLATAAMREASRVIVSTRVWQLAVRRSPMLNGHAPSPERLIIRKCQPAGRCGTCMTVLATH